jgi:hypothetical protein
VKISNLELFAQASLYIFGCCITSQKSWPELHRCSSCSYHCHAPATSLSGRTLLASVACDAGTPKDSMDKSEGRGDSNFAEMSFLVSWIARTLSKS